VLLTPLDTSGEKPYEEFVGEGEVRKIDVEDRCSGPACVLRRLMGCSAVNNPESAIEKAHIVSIIKNRLANFRHVESEKNLDRRL
jgi:hypothetical protein